MNKEAYKHGYSGSCAPGNGGAYWSTFSVGCFQWLPKASGKGLKKGPVKFRVKGSVGDPESVYVAAEEACRRLDDEWVPTTKSMTV